MERSLRSWFGLRLLSGPNTPNAASVPNGGAPSPNNRFPPPSMQSRHQATPKAKRNRFTGMGDVRPRWTRRALTSPAPAHDFKVIERALREAERSGKPKEHVYEELAAKVGPLPCQGPVLTPEHRTLDTRRIPSGITVRRSSICGPPTDGGTTQQTPRVWLASRIATNGPIRRGALTAGPVAAQPVMTSTA